MAPPNTNMPPGSEGPIGPIPEANRPGHHPEHEQDKPSGPPPRPRATARGGTQRFGFAFEPLFVPAAALFGVTRWTSSVEVTDTELRIRFGAWRLTTTLSNVASTEVTGPYRIMKVAGPARLSLADQGITFATNSRAGVCIGFRQPVPAILPGGRPRHTAVTVTVDRPEDLAALLDEHSNR